MSIKRLLREHHGVWDSFGAQQLEVEIRAGPMYLD